MTTGEVAYIEYKERGNWSTREEDLNYVSGTVHDAQGNPKYKFEGKYGVDIALTDLSTGRREVVYRAPKLLPTLQDPKKIYGMNLLAV